MYFSMWQSTPVPDNDFSSCISVCDRVHLYQIMSYSSCISVCDRVHLYQIMSFSSCISVCDREMSTQRNPVPDTSFSSCISVCDRVHLYQIMSFSSCISVCDRVHYLVQLSSCISVCDRVTHIWYRCTLSHMWNTREMSLLYSVTYWISVCDLVQEYSVHIMSFSLYLLCHSTVTEEYTHVPGNECTLSHTEIQEEKLSIWWQSTPVPHNELQEEYFSCVTVTLVPESTQYVTRVHLYQK